MGQIQASSTQSSHFPLNVMKSAARGAQALGHSLLNADDPVERPHADAQSKSETQLQPIGAAQTHVSLEDDLKQSKSQAFGEGLKIGGMTALAMGVVTRNPLGTYLGAQATTVGMALEHKSTSALGLAVAGTAITSAGLANKSFSISLTGAFMVFNSVLIDNASQDK